MNWSEEIYTLLVVGDIILESIRDISCTLLMGETKEGTDIISIMGKYTIEDCPGCIYSYHASVELVSCLAN